MRELSLTVAPPAETVRYDARPGLGALPEGTALWFAFAALQVLPLTAFLWAIWWPAPISTQEYVFSITATAVIAGAAVAVAWLLVRRAGASAIGLVIAPFIRLTVSDRRVLWRVPWRRGPLIQIEGWRVRGGLLGEVDARGRGSAAIVLQPGDWAGDAHGMIHFNRLPRVVDFVAAVGLLE